MRRQHSGYGEHRRPAVDARKDVQRVRVQHDRRRHRRLGEQQSAQKCSGRVVRSHAWPDHGCGSSVQRLASGSRSFGCNAAVSALRQRGVHLLDELRCRDSAHALRSGEVDEPGSHAIRRRRRQHRCANIAPVSAHDEYVPETSLMAVRMARRQEATRERSVHEVERQPVVDAFR